MANRNTMRKIIILDVDCVMTTGKFLYFNKSKMFKEFGPHDINGLKMLRKF